MILHCGCYDSFTAWSVICLILMVRPNACLFQDLDKKLKSLVLQSSDVSEETEECKRYAVLVC